MAKTIIVINRHRIGANRRLRLHPLEGHAAEPPISVRHGKHGKSTYPGNRVEGFGHYAVVYDPVNPLPCGAECWIEIEEAQLLQLGDTHYGDTVLTDEEKAAMKYAAQIFP